MSLKEKYPQLEPLSIFFEKLDADFTFKGTVDSVYDQDVIYVFGLSSMNRELKRILKRNKDVEIVFLVENIGHVLSFMARGLDKGFDHDRVHVSWRDEDEDDAVWSERIARLYPFEKIVFINNTFEKDRFLYLENLIYRKIVLATSVHKELMHYPVLCKNLFANASKVCDSFDIGKWKDKFSNTPAVICGAGPSLGSKKELLSNLEDDVMLFAGGSTLTVLDEMNITPHLGFLIDPNKTEYERMRHNFGFHVPLIYGNRVQKDIFRFFSQKTGYIRSDTGGLFEDYLDKALGIKDYGILKNLSEEALSVTSIALMTAIYLGCNPIYFAGIDLGYNEDRYSGNILSSWESNISAGMQSIIWNMEKKVIDQVCRDHKHVQFYQLSGKKAIFENVELVDTIERGVISSDSITSKVDNLIIDTKFGIKKEAVACEFKKIKDSLEQLESLIERYLGDHIPYSIFTHELDESESFHLFFKGMVYTMHAPLERKLRLQGELSVERMQKEIFEKVKKEAIGLSQLL